MELALKTLNLTKKFAGQLAVSDVNINIGKGDVYGFIGKNGAGKTTFIKMISGIAMPTSGEIQLFDSTNLNVERKKIGCVIENPALYPYFNARQNLEIQCKLLGIKDSSKVIDEILKIVGLDNTGKKKAKNFSLGMKQRLAIAIALIGDPEFLLLDEPINGLDPTGIKEVRDLIIKLNREHNKTVLISSHLLGELSKVATKYGIISNGKLIKEFSIEELSDIVKECISIKVSNVEAACNILKTELNTENYDVSNNGTINLYDYLDDSTVVTNAFLKSGLLIDSIIKKEPDFEDYFINLMEGKVND